MGPVRATEPDAQRARRVVARRWLLNLVLLLAVGMLALVAILRPGQDRSADAVVLTALKPGAITRIRIERHGQPAVALEKQQGVWRLSAPLVARTNRFLVERLLQLATAPSERRIAVAGATLREYGLDSPQAHVWFNDQEISVGSLHPLKNQGYVRYRDTVHLIAGHLLSAATARYSDFLDTRLLEDSRSPVEFTLPGISLVHRNGTWERQPPDNELSTDRINDFVEEWRHASALSVEKYSGKPVLDRIEIRFATGDGRETLSLGILAYRPEFILYREDEGLEYHLPEEAGRRLLMLSAHP